MSESDKQDLRRRFSALRGSIPAEERAIAETAIRERLFDLPAWRDAPLICGYMSMRSEIDMLPVWERAAAEGKGYALPVTLTGAKEGRMIFRRTAGFTPDGLISARFGVSEPAEDCPTLEMRDFEGALMLIPGLAYDDQGYRLGYGGGYYDRFLANLTQAGVQITTVGLAFSVCRTHALPRNPYDIPVNIIIDERRTDLIHGTQHHP